MLFSRTFIYHNTSCLFPTIKETFHAFQHYQQRGLRTTLWFRKRRRLIHVDDVSNVLSPIIKLPGPDEKLLYLTLGYTVKLDWNYLNEDIKTKMIKEHKDAKRQLCQQGLDMSDVNLIFPFHKLEDIQAGLIRHEKQLCVPVLTALNQRLIETFLPEEFFEIQKLMPQITKAFNAMRSRTPKECDKYKKAIPQTIRGGHEFSLNANDAILHNITTQLNKTTKYRKAK